MTRRLLSAAIAASFLAIAANQAARGQDEFVVRAVEVADPKAVFATVESVNVVPARARIGGILVELEVDEGDRVEAGQEIALVASQSLALQIEAINARIEAAQARDAQAQIDLQRAEELVGRGVMPRARLDETRTAASVARRELDAARAERGVLGETVSEGAVAAPTAGRVLAAPVTIGSVLLPGEMVASVASENYVLRLRLPERHARFLSVGAEVRVDAPELGGEAAAVARISQVYPQIQDGRVIADAELEGLGDFFVGERVRVWVGTELRNAIIAPADFLETRYGVDFVRVRADGDSIHEVAVQRGRPTIADGVENGVEILSGLAPGDVLVAP